jgi:hypothetical protein
MIDNVKTAGMQQCMTHDHMAQACGVHGYKILSWKAIFAGALVAIGLSFLLNLFCVAIGLTAYTTASDGVETLAFGGLLGAAIAMVASMFGAGWITGYVARDCCPKRHIGALYGFLAWTLALIITILLAAHIQQYVSFYTHFISGTGESFQFRNNAGPAAAPAVVATNVSANKLMISTYILFVLFFLGAFASSFGGHCGMRHRCREEV